MTQSDTPYALRILGVSAIWAATLLVGCAHAQPTTTTTTTSTETKGVEADARYLHLRLAIENRRTTQAMQRFTAWTAEDDCPPAVWRGLAEIQMREGDVTQAIATITTALAHHPDDTRLLMTLGQLRLQTGSLDEAAAVFERVLELEPHRQMALEPLSQIRLQELQAATSNDELTTRIHVLMPIYDAMLEGREGADRVIPLLISSALCLRLGEFETAQTRAEEAVTIDPENVRCYAAASDALQALKRYDDALDKLRLALLIQPSNTEIQQRINTLHALKNDWNGRADFYESVAADYPGIKELQDLAAKMLLAANKKTEARARLEHIVEFWPDDYDSATTLARLMIEADRWDEAEAMARRLIERAERPASLAALVVAAALAERGQTDRTRKVARLLEDATAPNDDFRLQIASIYMESGNEEEGLSLLEVFLKHRPEHFGATLFWIQALAQLGREDEAHAALDALPAAVREGHANELDHLRAALCLQAERYTEALDALDALVERDPDNPAYLLDAGLALQMLGRHEEAETRLREALRLAPDDPEALNNLGYFLAETDQKLDEALALLQRAVALRPDASHILDSLGWALYRMGRYDEALVRLERAVELTGSDTDAEILDHLGDTYAALNQVADALAQWQRALELDPDDTAIREKIERQESHHDRE